MTTLNLLPITGTTDNITDDALMYGLTDPNGTPLDLKIPLSVLKTLFSSAPGGDVDGSVQYNNGGAFVGNTNFKYDPDAGFTVNTNDLINLFTATTFNIGTTDGTVALTIDLSGNTITITNLLEEVLTATELVALNPADGSLCTKLIPRGTGYTVATLPVHPPRGTSAFVTDAVLSPVFLATATSGGGVVAPVFYNGSQWVFG